MVFDAVLKTVRYGRDKISQHEEMAAAAIDVGMLVERTASGVQPHSTAAEVGATPMFCKERRSGGMEFGDSYPADEVAMAVTASAGAGLHGLLATGESVNHGDQLVSDGAGALRLLDTAGGDDVSAVLATVDTKEASINRPAAYSESTTVDNSGGSDPIAVPIEVI